MKKFIFLSLCAFQLAIGSFAQTNITSSFAVNTTLTVANSPYVIVNSLDINAGVTVTIESGVEVRFNSGRYLQVFGTLNAKGVKFTANGSTAKGFWDGIYISYEYNANIGNATLDSCTVEYASNLYSRHGQLNLKKTTLNNFSNYGVQVSNLGTISLTNSVIKNVNYPLYLTGPGKIINGGNNQLTGNANDYIYMAFNNIPGVFDMPNLGVPYYCNYMLVTETGILNISPGTQLKFMNCEFTISGKIKALGTALNPIIFDMHPTASYWLGTNITANAIDTACVFKNCVFKNAKYDYEPYVAMEINSASPTFENCKFTSNARNLIVTGLSKPTFTNCNFEGSSVLSGECYNIGLALDAVPVFTNDSIKFNSKEIRAIKIGPSNVIDDAKLKKLSFKNLDNPSYCLYGTTTVIDTATLVIDPGVVIKCRDNSSMITANGTLTGIGTDLEPIIFTSIADDTYGNPLDSQNDGNVVPGHSSSGRMAIYGKKTSKIKNWLINYGGYNSGNWSVYVSNGNSVENCEIKNSYRGVYFSDNAQVLNNSFSNIDYFPVGRNVTQGTPVLLNNTVANVGFIGILIGGFGTDSPTLKKMDFAGYTNVAYIIESQLTIPTGDVVSVDPGVIIKFNQSYYGMLTVNGALKASGKATNKIIFTSIKDDSAGGDTNNNGTGSVPGVNDWQGIDFTGTASDTENILKNCEIRYCGYPSYWSGAIRITDCRVVMDSSKVNFCYDGALSIFGNANPQITNSQFYNLNNAPIYMDMFSNPTFANNKVANVPRIGLRIRGGEISGTVPVKSFAGYDSISYIIEETMTVTSQLTIPSGITFKGSGRWNIQGRLDVQGTAEKPVVFTTQEDDLYGSPKDMQQNGPTGLNNSGNYFIFYDQSNDLSTIDHAIFRYSATIPIQLTNASPKILNTKFENLAYVGISLEASSTPTINGCTFNNILFPFMTSTITYPAETIGNVISGTTGRAVRVKENELQLQNVTLSKRDFAGITNIPYVFHWYTVTNSAILTINPGVVCKFMQDGFLRIQNGLIAKGGSTVDSTIVFTADLDDFYGGDTYNNGDANLPTTYYWKGIYFYNESIDENCTLANCIIKDASDYYYYPYYAPYDPNRYAAITLDNSSPSIKNCLFDSNYYGIISRGTSLPKIANCDFVGTDPTYGYGIQNQTATNTVTATACWWNSNTGPKNATSNPGGQGVRVSDYVVFTPWATQLAKPVLGDVSMNGEVKPYDASLVLQYAASNITLSAKQLTVADVSGNGVISSYDASLILQYSVGLISRFDQLGVKSASINDLATISFPDLISEPTKKTFEIPLTVSSSPGIKALDMKFSINSQHVKFLRINKEKLPAGLNIEAGFNAQKGEIVLSMASAYDLNLISQPMILEFEFVDSSITESQFNLTTAMANDDFLMDIPAPATISSKTAVTGLNNQSQLSEPTIYTDQDGIHTRFELAKSNQNLSFQVVDIVGRIVYKTTVKNLSSGRQYFDLNYTDFENHTKGIYILNLRADDFSYSKKLLLK